MVTSKGTMTIALDPPAAPRTVNSFVFLARYHYFDGIVFHRVIPGFVLQGGDPTGTGTGGPGYKFADELPRPGRYELGSLAMANAGPDTNGSQFFVISGPDGHAPARPATRCSARSWPVWTTVAAIDAVGVALGQAQGEGHHRVGDDRRGGLTRRTCPTPTAPADRARQWGRASRPAGWPLTNTCDLALPRLAPAAVGVADEGGALGKAHHRQARGGQGDRPVDLLGVLVAEVRDHGQLLHHAEPDGERPAPGVDHGVGEHHGPRRGARPPPRRRARPRAAPPTPATPSAPTAGAWVSPRPGR